MRDCSVYGTIIDCFQVPSWREPTTKPHERDAGSNFNYGMAYDILLYHDGISFEAAWISVRI